jgi:4-hydroxybenzoate polyprenyltransferase
MKAIAAALRFLIFTNLYIATCVFCFTSKTAWVLNGNAGNFHVNALAFFSTLFLYGFHRIYRRFRLSQDEHREERHQWVDERKNLYYVIIGLAFLAMISQLCYMPIRVWIMLLPVGVIAAGYSIPVIKTAQGWIRIRDISWLKVLWISISYAWLTTFLPVVYHNPISYLWQPKVLFIFIENLIFIFVLAIPFDIRDISYDKRNSVNTLPILLGVNGAISLCLKLLCAFIAIVFLHMSYGGLNKYMATALCLSALEIGVILPLTKPERPNLFFPLAIESSMILQWTLILVAMYL